MLLPSIFLFGTLVFVAGCATASPDEGEVETLEGFQWENRLIVVFNNGRNTNTIETHMIREVELVEDRDILWFIVDRESVRTNYEGPLSNRLAGNLRDRYSTRPTAALEVVLIGKDGGVKNRLERLDTAGLYFQIDQMPMRIREMRENDQ